MRPMVHLAQMIMMILMMMMMMMMTTTTMMMMMMMMMMIMWKSVLKKQMIPTLFRPKFELQSSRFSHFYLESVEKKSLVS